MEAGEVQGDLKRSHAMIIKMSDTGTENNKAIGILIMPRNWSTNE